MRKGRFSKPVAEIAQRYGESVSFDWRLYGHDIAGSIAHAAAHEIVGNFVTRCAANKIPLNQVPPADLKNFSALFDSDVAEIFDISRALAKRQAAGAPSPDNIAAQIQRWRSDLGLTDESV